jgi:hypothetical protein
MKTVFWTLLFQVGACTSLFSQTTYSDIANILYRDCASCHRPGGGGPFSVLTYNETFPWAHDIEHVLNDGEMPPWGADTSYMHFVNEKILSANDKTAILNWIQDGVLEGDTALLPPKPIFPIIYYQVHQI